MSGKPNCCTTISWDYDDFDRMNRQHYEQTRRAAKRRKEGRRSAVAKTLNAVCLTILVAIGCGAGGAAGQDRSGNPQFWQDWKGWHEETDFGEYESWKARVNAETISRKGGLDEDMSGTMWVICTVPTASEFDGWNSLLREIKTKNGVEGMAEVELSIVYSHSVTMSDRPGKPTLEEGWEHEGWMYTRLDREEPRWLGFSIHGTNTEGVKGSVTTPSRYAYHTENYAAWRRGLEDKKDKAGGGDTAPKTRPKWTDAVEEKADVEVLELADLKKGRRLRIEVGVREKAPEKFPLEATETSRKAVLEFSLMGVTKAIGYVESNCRKAAVALLNPDRDWMRE